MNQNSIQTTMSAMMNDPSLPDTPIQCLVLDFTSAELSTDDYIVIRKDGVFQTLFKNSGKT